MTQGKGGAGLPGGHLLESNCFFGDGLLFFVMVSTRSVANKKQEVCNNAASPSTPKAATCADNNCAICLSPLNERHIVRLFCGHMFHAQCAVDSLQHNRRCPLCRHEERIEQVTNDDLYDDGYIDRCETIVHTRLVEKASVESMRHILKDFDVPDAEVQRANKRLLADMVVEQMLYETDDSDDDE
mgnify:CR=1 FL=1